MSSNRWSCFFLSGFLIFLMYVLVSFCKMPGWVAFVAYVWIFICAVVYVNKASDEEEEMLKLKQRVKELEKKLEEKT